MELVILKARAQLNRLVSGERRARAERPRPQGGAEGRSGARAGRARSMAPASAAPTPHHDQPWLNATLLYNASRLNLTFDTDYELLNANSTDDHDNPWFCAKWTNAQQDLFQVLMQLTIFR